MDPEEYPIRTLRRIGRIHTIEWAAEALAVLLPPIRLLAALRYYRAGHVDFAVAGLLALGFFFGASIGAVVATKIEGHILRKIFGGFLFLVSLHMMFGHHGR